MNALPAAAVKPPKTSTCRTFGVMVWHLSSVLMRLAVIARIPRGTMLAGMFSLSANTVNLSALPSPSVSSQILIVSSPMPSGFAPCG